MSQYLDPGYLYEVPITSLKLHYGQTSNEEMVDVLKNGRGSYIIFERLIRTLTGLVDTPKGNQSDHLDLVSGSIYEQKSYLDPQYHPRSKDMIETGPSTFKASNAGARVYRSTLAGDPLQAFEMVNRFGYSKNDFYLYTNTGQFILGQPFRYFVVAKEDVLTNLHSDFINLTRSEMLAMNTKGTFVLPG